MPIMTRPGERRRELQFTKFTVTCEEAKTVVVSLFLAVRRTFGPFVGGSNGSFRWSPPRYGVGQV